MALQAQDLERWWPEVARRLSGALARRGVRGADAEDIVQETALRALAAAPPVASSDELARWSFTVSRRIEIDRARRRRRVELVGAEPADARPAAADTAREAESRLALAVAAKGLATLSASDRMALLSVLDDDNLPAADRRTAVREAVRRHRARLRLVALVGKLVGAGVAAVHALRKSVHKLRPTYAEVGFVVAVGALLAAPSASGPASAASPAGLATSAVAAAPTALEPGAAVPASTPVARSTSSAAVPATAATPVPAPSSPQAPAPPAELPARRLTLPVDPGGPGGGGNTTVGVLSIGIAGVGRVYGDNAAWCSATTPKVECARDNVRLSSR